MRNIMRAGCFVLMLLTDPALAQTTGECKELCSLMTKQCPELWSTLQAQVNEHTKDADAMPPSFENDIIASCKSIAQQKKYFDALISTINDCRQQGAVGLQQYIQVFIVLKRTADQASSICN
jgi:hypothetical protein